jgi:hypothetical protein
VKIGEPQLLNGRARLLVCAAGFALAVNYANHAPMISTLRTEFAFNLAKAGPLTTGTFLTHALMQIPGGGWLAHHTKITTLVRGGLL